MRKRRAYTAKEKLDAVEHVKRTGDVAATTALFFPMLSGTDATNRRKLVWSWVRDEDKLRAACATGKGAARKKVRPQGITATLSPEAEEEIVVWLNDLRGEGVPVSSLMLSLQAKKVAVDTNADPTFEAS